MLNKQYPFVFVIAALAIGLGIGFFGGTEYKSYQIRKAFSEIGESFNSAPSGADVDNEEVEKPKEQIIQKQMTDEVELATIRMKVNNVEEKQTLSVSYDSPRVAQQGRKFVVLTVDLTNITKDTFSFYPEGIKLVDDKDRAYETFSDGYGTANYLNGRELAPDLKETGTMIFEIPSDSEHYSLTVAKAGTSEVYKVAIK